ncbi:MAG: putative manganese-dependent inorganic diphosphatase [Eubacteriales bacterium]|nr:putative manganese-dependent inorganic diphosphatase [Eubacteriales bacterium]
MNNKSKKVYVVGHKNPDTDSICSAIAYANLKRLVTGERYSARRAGQISEETQYVLKRFQVKTPKLLNNVKLQAKDADIHMIEGAGPNASIKHVWGLMKRQGMKTVPVLEDDELIGIATAGDIARSYMEMYDDTILGEAKTQYQNIIDTLDGTLLTGDPEAYFTNGKVAIGASSPELMTEFIGQGDLVILGNRYESHSCAIDINVRCIVVCQNAPVSEILVKRAESQGIVIIQTPHDTFNVARLINQSAPVKYFMTKRPSLCTFCLDDYMDDVRKTITKVTFREFPILNRQGKLQGFISRRRVMTVSKKQVILVDHNEKSQAVDGLEEADILEIIDHHRLGNIETVGPVYFRNQPVGCTATIIYQMYQENQVEITPQIAGLLCSAIISDTLLFRSPTCTSVDVATAEKLAEIADIDMEELAASMFRAGSNLHDKTPEELCFRDFKQFTVGEKVFGVGQINSMSKEELDSVKESLREYLPVVLQKNSLDMIYFMLTDILDEASEILCCGQGAKQAMIEAFGLPEDTGDIVLKKVVSRKKQVVPVLVAALQQ